MRRPARNPDPRVPLPAAGPCFHRRRGNFPHVGPVLNSEVRAAGGFQTRHRVSTAIISPRDSRASRAKVVLFFLCAH